MTYTTKMPILLAVLLAVLCVFNAAAISTYSQSVTNSTSVTITNAQHGMGSANVGVHVYDNSGNRTANDSYTVSINGSTYAVTVSWASSFTGTVKITGPWTGVSSASTDFEPAFTTASSKAYLQVCLECATYNALRADGGYSYFSANYWTFNTTIANTTVRAWITPDGYTRFGVSAASGTTACSWAGAPAGSQLCSVQYGVTSWPSGTHVKLASGITNGSGNGWSSTTDERPTSFR